MSTKLYLNFPYSNERPYLISSGDKEIVAGRAPTCDLHLARYLQGPLQAVSREHFKIHYRKNEGFIIVDISHNGTQVNEDPLTKGRPRILRDGDTIKLARDDNLVILVEIDDDPEVTVSIDDPDVLTSPEKIENSAGLYFDEIASQFSVDGEPIPHEHLTKLEATLLRYLYTNAGRLCTFDDIAFHVWNDPGWTPGNNTISRAVGNLRKKLNQISPGAQKYVQNIRGQGYKIEPH